MKRLLLIVLAGLALAGPATGAPSLAEPEPFLARYGLVPQPAAFQLVPPASLKEFATGDVEVPLGVSLGGEVRVDETLTGLDLAETALHEWGHQVSRPAWSHTYCDQTPQYCTRAFAVRYEEGPVQAVTSDLLANYWRWLTGKRLKADPAWNAYHNTAYPGPVLLWRAASVRATGQPVRSRAAQEWRRSVLLTAPEDRPALLAF